MDGAQYDVCVCVYAHINTREHTQFWSENLNGKDHLQDLYVDGDNSQFKFISWERADQFISAAYIFIICHVTFVMKNS